MKRFLSALILLSSLASAAEDFRVQVIDAVEVDPAFPEGSRSNLGYADGMGISIPADRSFLAGVEIEVRIPAAAQSRPDSFLCDVYASVRPAPSTDAVAYAGRRIHRQVLPARVSQVLHLPIGKDSGLKAGPYATLLEPLDASSFPLVFRIFPAMKGLSQELEKAVFQVRVRPLLKEEGRLRLRIEEGPGLAKGAQYRVSVDGAEVADPKAPLILKSGSHDLRVTGPEIRDEYRSFTLERAKELVLDIVLKDVTPRLVLEYPEHGRVELDGKALPPDARGAEPGIPLTPGEHMITFLVGDYAIQRKLSVQRGRTYRVSLLIDLEIAEE